MKIPTFAILVGVSLYAVLRFVVAYGSIFSAIVSFTVGLSLLCLSSGSSSSPRSLLMKYLRKYKKDDSGKNQQQDEAFLKALKSNGEIVDGIQMIKAIETGKSYVKNLLNKKPHKLTNSSAMVPPYYIALLLCMVAQKLLKFCWSEVLIFELQITSVPQQHLPL